MVLKSTSTPNKNVKKVKKSAKKLKPSERKLEKQSEPAWKSLHPVAANPVVRKHLLTGPWDFKSMDGVAQKIIAKYPAEEFNFFVFLGNEAGQPADDSEEPCSIFPVLHLIIVPRGLKELPWFLRLKAAGENDAELVEFYRLKLRWEGKNGILPGLKLNCLVCDRTEAYIAKRSDADQSYYEYANIVDFRPSKAFPVKTNGDIDVRFAHFTVTLPDGKQITDVFYKDFNMTKAFIPHFIEENKLTDDDETYNLVKDAIKGAFQSARKKLQAEKDWILGEYSSDEIDLLEQVKCVKIYPSNFVETDKVQATDHEFGPAELVL